MIKKKLPRALREREETKDSRRNQMLEFYVWDLKISGREKKACKIGISYLTLRVK